MAKAKTIGRCARESVAKENIEARAYKNGLRFLDAQGAATFLGISLATIRVWSAHMNGQKPRIPLIKISRNLIRYDKESLTQWLKLQESLPEEMRSDKDF